MYAWVYLRAREGDSGGAGSVFDAQKEIGCGMVVAEGVNTH